MSDIDKESVSVLGTEAMVVRYKAHDLLVDPGLSLDIYVPLSKVVEHDDDFVFFVVVYPQIGGLRLSQTWFERYRTRVSVRHTVDEHRRGAVTEEASQPRERTDEQRPVTARV